MAVRVAVCGPLTVLRDGDALTGPRLGTRKARVLVAVLAAARRTAVPTDRLVEALWADGPPRDPEGNVATLASRLRRVAGEGFVVPGSGSYALGRDVTVDLDVAADLLGSAAARLAREEPTLAAASAARAVDLLGERLAGECDAPWAESLRGEASALRRDARHLLAVSAIATGQPDVGHGAAVAAVAEDPYDERAHRDLMRALAADGRVPAALAAFAGLATRLAEDLGTDPDLETQRLHMALLRGDDVRAPQGHEVAAPATALVGREEELALLDGAWARAAAGQAGFVLVVGVPGIGKTRLLSEVAALARGSGGNVLAARCRPGERSLFLQPFVEVLRPVLLAMPETTLRTLLGGHLPMLARLLPELAELFGVEPDAFVSGELVRRQAFDAMLAVVAGLAAQRPLLLTVDDLQYGADATTDLVAHLAVQLRDSRVLVLAASRSDALPGMAHAAALGDPLLLGPLSSSAVDALAEAAGFPSRAAEVRARTRGHPLSVVASLRSLAGGTPGVPVDVADAVAGQLRLLDPGVARAATAGSVLGTHVVPPLLGELLGRPEVDVVLACEQLVATGLMTVSGADYDFANDLVCEAVLGSLPPALAVAYHRRAADLLGDRPEQMAAHARAAGEPARAAAGFLEAGRRARGSAALDDALALLTLASDQTTTAGEPALTATVLLERARVNEARADFVAAEADVHAARAAVGAAAPPRLEMRSRLLLGGDISVGCHRPLDEVVAHNRSGLRSAGELGDAVAMALFQTRIVVLESSRLRLSEALATARRGLAHSRSVGSAEAVARSLDGLKSVHAYCGDATALAATIDELVPLLTELRLPWLLQWAHLESALVPAARGDFAAARQRVDRALEVNRETGYGAYTGFFRAQRAWLARLAGNLDTALRDGRRAVAEASPTAHPWWYATAVGSYATTLLEAGRRDEVASLCAAGLAALGPEAGAAYRLRCLAPLAAATGEGLAEADALVAAIVAPPGRAWVLGADVYDALATAWRSAGEPERAATVLRPLLAATTGSWRGIHDRVAQRTSATSAAARSAPPSGTGR